MVGRLKGFVTLVPDKQASLIVDAIAGGVLYQPLGLSGQDLRVGGIVEGLREHIAARHAGHRRSQKKC